MRTADTSVEKKPVEYLRVKFGHGSEKTLAKLAVTGGGPVYRKAGKMVFYTPEDLDNWALSMMGVPRRTTSDVAEAT